MNMMKKMKAIEIARYINTEVGMEIAHNDKLCNVVIDINHDFLGNEILFHDYLFCGDLIYSYINQHGFKTGVAVFGTNSYAIPAEPNIGFECFNPDSKHVHDCEFDYDTGIRKFDKEILKNAVEGLKKALKVTERSKLTISNEVEFMDI